MAGFHTSTWLFETNSDIRCWGGEGHIMWDAARTGVKELLIRQQGELWKEGWNNLDWTWP